MKFVIQILVFSCVITTCFVSVTAAQTVQQVVDSFYPELRLEPDASDDRRSCYGVVETTAGVPTTIVAGYTADTDAMVRVLRTDGAGGYTVAWDSPESWNTAGNDCEVEVNDVDADGALEAFVTFSRRRGTTGWMLKWNGTTVENITPTKSSGGLQLSLFDNPSLWDLEHDGTLQVTTVGGGNAETGQPETAPDLVYHIGPAGYQLEKAMIDAWPFRAGADARTWVHGFKLVQDSVGPYTIRIINGARGGANRVSGATLEINGVPVAGANQLNSSVEFLTVSVPTLPVENILRATLTGATDSTIIVVVEDSTKRN